MSLSSVLKTRRKELGLTLAQIAEKMGVSEATVQRWESGNIKTLRYDKIAPLADILKVHPSDIMGWDNDMIRLQMLADILGVKLSQLLSITDPDDAHLTDSIGSTLSFALDRITQAEKDGKVTSKEKASWMEWIDELFDVVSLSDFTGEGTPLSIVGNDPRFDKLLILYNGLNSEGKEKLVNYADDLVSSGKYTGVD